jgi:DNA adenine methylase
MKANQIARPFLKWAGGKRQLLPSISEHLPRHYQTYYEPFIGAGALLFHVQPKIAVVSDTNSELINCYEVVRDEVELLIEELRLHSSNNSEPYYYEIRDWDRNREQYNHLPPIRRCSRIIYLNKTCYNGLFRVNSQGQFNVPFGKYKNPNILDDAVLRAVSGYLKSASVRIKNLDFEDAVADTVKGDFVYFDPPYDPVSDTASFTGYDVNGFNRDEQHRLQKVFEELDCKGCKVLQSNADTPFIEQLYSRYKIIRVEAARAINSNAAGRGKIGELLIKNY